MPTTKKPEEEEVAAEETDHRQAAEACGHPTAHGVCWFSQIAEPCGYACKWLIDQGEDAGR